MNINLIEIVIEDLEYLKEEWGGHISTRTIRHGSAILRRLLIEDNLGRAWRELGFKNQPSIHAINLDSVLKQYQKDVLIYALAGGAKLSPDGKSSLNLAVPILLKGTLDPSKHLEKEPPMSMLPLVDYLKSSSAYIKGQKISRADVIKYIANVRGGVHIANKITRKSERELVRRVGKFENKLNFFNKDGLSFELLSIGQSIISSPDVEKILKS